jgi:hypothetical protein
MCERDVGLFSLVQQVIGNIPFALYERRVPIAYFGPRCSYWTAQGYRGRDTVWEYYFEPIIPEWPSSTVPKHIRELIEEKPPLHWDFGYYSEDGAFITNNYGGHRKFKGKSMVVPFEFDDPSDRFRRRAVGIIKKYVRVRAEIREKAESLYSSRMAGRPNIGVHLRGTDALVELRRIKLGHQLDFARYCERIDFFLKAQSDARIFVASDSESCVKRIREIYGDRVTSTDAIRHTGGALAGKGPTGSIMPAHLTVAADIAARSGEEAVIDYLLLSRCSALVHNGSSLARTVMLAVPEMAVANINPRPSYLERRAFYWRKARWRKTWQRRLALVYGTLSGEPIMSWYGLLRNLLTDKRRQDAEIYKRK